MASKLETFLNENKIDTRRLLVTSRQLERLRPEDRAIKLKQTQARKADDGKKLEALDKPRSGRPVTERGLRTALAGESVSGPQKTRILRAVNKVLEHKKKDPVGLHQLFDVPVLNPPKPKAEEPAEGGEAEAADGGAPEAKAAEGGEAKAAEGGDKAES